MTEDLQIKVADFGSAVFTDRLTAMPDAVARHYRPPEVILGDTLGTAVDIWSAAVCLIELATGSRLFNGANNPGMIQAFWDAGIDFDYKWLSGCKQANIYFHFTGTEGSMTVNLKASSETGGQPRTPVSCKRQLRYEITSRIPDHEPSRLIADFHDLISRMLVTDPRRRLTASQALAHSFLR